MIFKKINSISLILFMIKYWEQHNSDSQFSIKNPLSNVLIKSIKPKGQDGVVV